MHEQTHTCDKVLPEAWQSDGQLDGSCNDKIAFFERKHEQLAMVHELVKPNARMKGEAGDAELQLSFGGDMADDAPKVSIGIWGLFQCRAFEAVLERG